MSKRRAIGLALAVVAVIAVIAVVSTAAFSFFHPRDPIVHGKPVSYWISTLGTNDVSLDQRAMQWSSFGTNGIPMLLQALQMGTSRPQRAYQSVWPKLPGLMQRVLPRPNPALIIRGNAMYLLGRMGAAGAPAIPILIDTLRADPERMARFNAIDALGRIAPADATPPVPQQQAVCMAMIATTRDADWMIRMNAATFLGNAAGGTQTAEIVPALSACLNDPEAMVRYRAAISLGSFGPAARPAVPALVKLLEDKDPNNRTAAAAALQKIGSTSVKSAR